MADEVSDLLAVTAFVGQPVLPVGHSSGVVVALEAALAESPRFVGVVLYEPPIAVTTPLGGDAVVRAEPALKAGRPDEAMKIHLREIVEAPNYLVSLLPIIRPLWRQVVAFAQGQIRDDVEIESLGVGIDRYRQVDVPVLLLGGSRSPRHLRVRLDALAQVLPQLDSVVILKGQGHLANARAPGNLAKIIETFAHKVT